MHMTSSELTYQQRLDRLHALKLEQARQKRQASGPRDADEQGMAPLPAEAAELVEAMSGSGVMVRDLVLKGFGDPTLATADLDELARDVEAEGIEHVTGRIRGDESFFDARRDAPGWKAGFLGLESPPLSALVVDRAKGWPRLSPPLLAARAFREALLRRGITVDGVHGLGRDPGRRRAESAQ